MVTRYHDHVFICQVHLLDYSMAKRKLSFQQRRRIEAQRAKRKVDLASSHAQDTLNEIDPDSLGPLQTGVVIAHFGHEVLVGHLNEPDSTNTDQHKASPQKCYLRANTEICTGDNVLWRRGQTIGVVESCEPRQTQIQRPDAFGSLRTIAANISQMLIVVAPEPEPHPGLIDRYLIAATLSNIISRIIVNKSDLSGSESLIKALSIYPSLNYSLHTISTQNNADLTELEAILNNNTSIFVGQSGVGKSSIIQQLLPKENIRIGALSHAQSKGRHTTTHSQLYALPSGGYLVDSPGIREFGLWHATKNDVLNGFPEIAHAAQFCVLFGKRLRIKRSQYSAFKATNLF